MNMFAIGIDGGGTSCRAAVADENGQVLGTGRGGAANIVSDSEGARESIIESARAALESAGLPASAIADTTVVLGVAGANVGPHGARMEKTLPFARTKVVTDSSIALEGALGAEDGIVGAFGTGSVYSLRRDGKIRELGGWGFVIGDQASGARLGRDLLENALLAHDGVRQATPLTTLVMAEYGNDPEKVVEFGFASKPKDFARYAPLVFSHALDGDPVATAIVRKAVGDIEETLASLLWPECRSICLLGGLAAAYRPLMSETYRDRLREPQGDALQGAVSFALKLARNGERMPA